MLREQPSVRVSSRAHKMSKSRGNVVNPDDVVTVYGADSLRLYEMFMGPLRDTKVCTFSAWHQYAMVFVSRTYTPGIFHIEHVPRTCPAKEYCKAPPLL